MAFSEYFHLNTPRARLCSTVEKHWLIVWVGVCSFVKECLEILDPPLAAIFVVTEATKYGHSVKPPGSGLGKSSQRGQFLLLQTT